MSLRFCRTRLASARRFGIRNRFFEAALRRSQTRLSTLKVVSMQTFQAGSIETFCLFTQCLAAPFSRLLSLSTRQMLRFVGESCKHDSVKLSTGGQLAGGQLGKVRNRL
jgi:hypothetical protein